MYSPQPDEIINFEGPEGESLFRRMVAWCFSPTDQTKLQASINENLRFIQTPGDDRSLVLVGALLIEQALDKLLLAYIPGYSSLAKKIGFTFAMKINLGKALELLPQRVLNDAEFLKGLRNKFAHKLELRSLDSLPSGTLKSMETRLHRYNPGDRPKTTKAFEDLVTFVAMALEAYAVHVHKLSRLIRTREFLNTQVRAALTGGQETGISGEGS